MACESLNLPTEPDAFSRFPIIILPRQGSQSNLAAERPVCQALSEGQLFFPVRYCGSPDELSLYFTSGFFVFPVIEKGSVAVQAALCQLSGFSFDHMALKYTLKRDGDILFVRLTGSDDGLREVERYVLDVIRAALDEGLQRILCDETGITTRLDTLETFDIGTFLSRNTPPSFRIAIIYDPQAYFDFRFFESVAVNRGMQLRIFTDIDPAREWLLNS